MRIEEKDKVLEIQESVKIKQEDHAIILEKGDRIRVLKEDQTVIWAGFLANKMLEHATLSEFVFEIPYNKVRVEGVNSLCRLEGNSLKISINSARTNEFIITPEPSDVVTIREDRDYGFKIQLTKLGAVFYGYY